MGDLSFLLVIPKGQDTGLHNYGVITKRLWVHDLLLEGVGLSRSGSLQITVMCCPHAVQTVRSYLAIRIATTPVAKLVPGLIPQPKYSKEHKPIVACFC